MFYYGVDDKGTCPTAAPGNVTIDKREGGDSRTSRRKAGGVRMADLGQGVGGKDGPSRHSSVTSENNSCGSNKKKRAAKRRMMGLANLGQPSRWAAGGAERQVEEGGKNKTLSRADLGTCS